MTNEWTKYRLSELCDLVIGKTPRREVDKYWGDGNTWASISDLRTKEIVTTKEEITDIAIKDSGCKVVQKGTVLLSFKLSIGKVAFAGKNLYTNEAIVALPIIKPKLIVPEFLYYALRFIPLTGGNKAAKGVTLNKGSLAKLKIPVPKRAKEQIRIATLLSKAETLIAQRKESLRLLDELLKSTFLEMFGDPVRNEKEWEKAPLSNLGSLNRGVSKHRPRNAPELLGGPYPLIQTGEVANSGLYIISYSQTYSELGLKQSKLWPTNTLCITIAANIAKTGTLDFDACFPDSVVGFIANPEESNSIYVHYLFGFFQRLLEKNAPQAAQKNINLGILRNLRVPKPNITIQTQFAQIVEKVEALKAHYQASLDELENLYGSLSQRALKGELDLSRVKVHTPEEVESTEPNKVPVDYSITESRKEALVAESSEVYKK